MTEKLLQVYVFEFARSFRRKGYLFATFGIPLIVLVLLYGYQTLVAGGLTLPDLAGPSSFDFETVTASGYVDASGLFDSDDLLRRFDDEVAARIALENGEVDSYFLIPQNYLETGEIIQVMPSLSLTAIDESAARRLVLNTLADDVDPDVLARLSDPSDFTVTNVQRSEAAPGDFDTTFIFIYPFVMALLLSLFMTNGYLMQGVIEEKETRVIEILVASLRPSQLLIGKILAYGTLGLLQFVVWLGGMLFVLSQADFFSSIAILGQFSLPPATVPLMLVYFVLAYLFFASAYGILGALSTSMREGPQFAVIFTLPAVAPLWFTSLFIATPDAPLVVGLSLFPLTAPLGMLQRVLVTDVPAWQIALSLVLLALTIVAVMWLAGRVFRVQTLLAGQLPKLRDLPRLVRG